MKNYQPSEELLKRLNNDFIYHDPKDGQLERYTQIRTETGSLAKWLTTVCPPSRELSLAITHLEEAMFYANAAIARNE